MFKNVFSFEGRIRRMEYGLTILGYLVCALTINFLVVADDSYQFLLFLYFPILWITIAQAAKRCHDRGNSGWWQLIPFYGFWLLFADSDYGDNEYGPNPKGLGNRDEVEEIGSYLA